MSPKGAGFAWTVKPCLESRCWFKCLFFGAAFADPVKRRAGFCVKGVEHGTGATRSPKGEHGEDQPFDAGSWLAQGSINAKGDIEIKARPLFFGESEAQCPNVGLWVKF